MNKRSLYILKDMSASDEVDLFEHVFDQFPDMIHSVDSKGKICWFNKRACDLLGYTREELMGKDVFEVYAPEIKEALSKGFAELRLSGSKDRIASKIMTKSGEIIDVEIRSLSLYNEKGEFVQTLSIFRDMRELNLLRSSLIQQSKLASIGELAGGIMHDIRNPLTIIMSYNEFIKSALETNDTKMISTAQNRIERASGRIEKLSNHLREFCRVEADEPESFLIKDLLSESLMMVETRIARYGVQLVNKTESSTASVIGRPNRLEQVFINLISNACDACGESGRAGIVTLDIEAHPYKVDIIIEDNANGIKPENLERIFEAFFTTKPKSIGTGLGLSICAGIIQDQGGYIKVESTIGQGSKFTVSLPYDTATPLPRETGHRIP